MIDSHAHMTTRVGGQQAEVKIGGVILAGSCLNDSRENIEFAKNDAKVWAAVGIHPQPTEDEKITIEQQIEVLDELAGKTRVVAVGEIGLDFTTPPPPWPERPLLEQEILFKKQIEVAQKHNLPLIIHTRKAFDETLEILRHYQNLRGVIHCYTGGKKRIAKVMELGPEWFFGIDGNLTYEIGLNEVVKNIPTDRLMAETDSPFLTPIPHRGEINNPNYVEFVYRKIAEIWEMSFEETEKILDSNVKKLFRLP